MAYFDLPLDQLYEYLPDREEPADFDSFWAGTLGEAGKAKTPTVFAPAYEELRALDVYDVTFSGYAGQPVKAWLIIPKRREGQLPTVVEFVGYGAGRGLPSHWLTWASAGYANLVMDTRGQGSMWVPGETSDHEPGGSGPQYPGFLTRGVLDPSAYYYRRVFTDAARAVEAASEHEAVDSSRLVVAGGSQGGGIALAAGALTGSVVAALVDVPFLSHYRRAIEVTDSPPYSELRSFLAVHRERTDEVFRTLSYFDGMNFAARSEAPMLMSVGLMDDVCPPSTVFAAFNHYAGPKEIKVWPYNGHDAGSAQHVHEKIRFLHSHGLIPEA